MCWRLFFSSEKERSLQVDSDSLNHCLSAVRVGGKRLDKPSRETNSLLLKYVT